MKILEGSPTDPQVLALLREHLSNMRLHSPPTSVHALEPDDLLRDNVSLWCAWIEDELAGCVALKQLDSHHGEIKSMITSSSHLRKGVASALLRRVIQEARSRGYHRLSLETGSDGVFVPAQRLYTKFGFQAGGPFAQYEDDGFAVFMTINLLEKD